VATIGLVDVVGTNIESRLLGDDGWQLFQNFFAHDYFVHGDTILSNCMCVKHCVCVKRLCVDDNHYRNLNNIHL
jgi:hypothetical protein